MTYPKLTIGKSDTVHVSLGKDAVLTLHLDQAYLLLDLLPVHRDEIVAAYREYLKRELASEEEKQVKADERACSIRKELGELPEEADLFSGLGGK